MKKLRKGKYKVVNWSEYNKSLKNRGDITFWISDEAIDNWLVPEETIKSRGRQIKYSEIALETIYIFRQIYKLPLRQSEGFVRSILKIMNVNVPIPDYSTVSRRVRNLDIKFLRKNTDENINVILDSSGIKVVGEKEWINYKYDIRQRKIWRKLHIAVTDKGEIVAGEITNLRKSDIATVPELLEQIHNDINQIVGDGAYYKKRMLNYMKQFLQTKYSKFIGPPKNKSKSYGHRIKVEETFSRYKRIIGNKFKAKHFQAQKYEAKLSLKILNKMFDIGRPKTIRVA